MLTIIIISSDHLVQTTRTLTSLHCPHHRRHQVYQQRAILHWETNPTWCKYLIFKSLIISETSVWFNFSHPNFSTRLDLGILSQPQYLNSILLWKYCHCYISSSCGIFILFPGDSSLVEICIEEHIDHDAAAHGEAVFTLVTLAWLIDSYYLWETGNCGGKFDDWGKEKQREMEKFALILVVLEIIYFTNKFLFIEIQEFHFTGAYFTLHCQSAV